MVRGCRHRDSNLKGWELFAIASGAFPPSKEFEPYLLAYCHRHREDPIVGKHASYTMGRLLMAQDLPPRKEIPTAIEVEAVKVGTSFASGAGHVWATHVALHAVHRRCAL